VFLSILSLALAATPAPLQPPSQTLPPHGGTVAIQPKTADGDYAPSLSTFVGAASDAFANKGFTILDDPAHAAYIAELILTRVAVGTGRAKAPAGKAAASAGGPPSTVGAGVTIPLSTGKSMIVPLQRTQIEVRIHKRGDQSTVWDGAAMTVRAAGTRSGADAAVAADLCQALLNSYPAQPADVIGVP
jgi:hypothetical protein